MRSNVYQELKLEPSFSPALHHLDNLALALEVKERNGGFPFKMKWRVKEMNLIYGTIINQELKMKLSFSPYASP